ncbi:MAG: MarR family EPS-associated transcriptional regulator [Syntrophales bacterium]|jgi:EPS-associated MarR family transcriptional regulator|nr:MarR family EPS-associated transcriptional regulator [Syntrophales bacterium]MDY0043760.1 MarR family EPS-associated transcriptional regulator [Syntrophales bacterium]
MHENSFNFESEEVLKLLQEIKGEPNMTQRELSLRLGVSLGKVNYLLKSLIRKGYVKVNNFKKSDNKNAYLYMLTPRGIEEKLRITYWFLKRKKREYEFLEEEIKRLKKEISKIRTSINEEHGGSIETKESV